MNDSVVVDTNVAIVANGRADHASPSCQLACLKELLHIQRDIRVLLDSAGAILTEYLNQKPHQFPQGAGDQFLIWLWDNQANPDRCTIVPVTPLHNDKRMFEEFPADPALAGFDPSDRKFVAVAIASKEHPPILNAVDSDWQQCEADLRRHNVHVQNLCT